MLADEGRPRAVVVAGIGTAGLTGNILATVAGPRCPVPIIGHRSAGVPGWVGAADVVIAVSRLRPQPRGAGRRRGGRPPRCPAGRDRQPRLASCRRWPSGARAPFIPVPRRAPARASLWGLTVPVLLAARSLGLVKVNEADLAETAARLDADAERCRPGAESFVNPAKSLALGLAGSVPIVWGSSPLATVAARRFADTLAANARYPVMAGALGEAGRGPGGPARRRVRRAGRVGAATSSPTRTTRTSRTRPGCGWCCCATAASTPRTTPTSRSPSRSAAPTRCRRWPSGAACAATC